MAVVEAVQLDRSLIWETHQGITFPLGYSAGSAWCGFKSKRDDLALIVSDLPASAAGVFTQNLFKASSVVYSQKVVKQGSARAIFCSSGNANACVGEQGMVATIACAELAAGQVGCAAEDVLVAHTGIIGKPYEVEKAKNGISKLSFGRGSEADNAVALSILTTDTCEKQIAISVRSPFWDGELRIGGVCKGSGMIAPNMATTLCFLTTDAHVSSPLLQQALSNAIDNSFNKITVDGDTSTNDMALLLANGAGQARIDNVEALSHFESALEEICVRLAQMVARDGEGATKLVHVTVSDAATEQQAHLIAKTIAESPLVKTALFGNDPNWGRVLAAAGRSGSSFDAERTHLSFGPHVLFSNTMATDFDKIAVHEYLKQNEIDITLSLGHGKASATVWTCDYSYDYIRINAEYHT